MKKKILACSLFALLAVAAAFGSWSDKLAVAVPFDFYVGDKAMPAGTYVIASTDATGGTLTLDNRVRGQQVVVATKPASQSTTSRSELVFERYGAAYFLAKIWNATADTGRALPVSQKQIELSKAGGTRAKQLALVIQR